MSVTARRQKENEMEYDVERMRRRLSEKDAEIARLKKNNHTIYVASMVEEDIQSRLAEQKQRIVEAVKGMSDVRMPNGRKPGDALLPESQVLAAIDKACETT